MTSKKAQGFNQMNEKDIKKFLSNDLIERMIKVEKRVGKSLGEEIPTEKTVYFKSLSKEEKKEFQKFMKEKKRKLLVTPLFMVLLLMALLGSGIQITGNVAAGGITYSGLQGSFVALFTVTTLIACFFLFFLMSKRKHEKKFEKKFHILDRIVEKRV